MADGPPRDALRDATRTAIADLRPDIADQTSRVIDGVVTITWPYSIVTKSVAFILAERDVLLRRNRGQLRVEFHGAAGRAVADLNAGGGDHVRLSLEGAQWTATEGKAGLPGGSLEWQLKFSHRLLLTVRKADCQQTEALDIRAPEEDGNEQLDTSLIPSPPPLLESFGDDDSLGNATPVTQRVDSRIPSKRPASSITDLDEEFASPAFLKRARVSYGSLFEDGLDLFGDGKLDKRKQVKKRRSLFGQHDAVWRYTSRSPSETSEVENLPQIDTPADDSGKEVADNVTPHVEVPGSRRSTMVDEGCQTQESHSSQSMRADGATQSRFGEFDAGDASATKLSTTRDANMHSPSRTLFGPVQTQRDLLSSAAEPAAYSLAPGSSDHHFGLSLTRDRDEVEFAAHNAVPVGTDSMDSGALVSDDNAVPAYASNAIAEHLYHESGPSYEHDMHHFSHIMPEQNHALRSSPSRELDSWQPHDTSAYPPLPELSNAAILIDSSPPPEDEVGRNLELRSPPRQASNRPDSFPRQNVFMAQKASEQVLPPDRERRASSEQDGRHDWAGLHNQPFGLPTHEDGSDSESDSEDEDSDVERGYVEQRTAGAEDGRMEVLRDRSSARRDEGLVQGGRRLQPAEDDGEENSARAHAGEESAEEGSEQEADEEASRGPSADQPLETAISQVDESADDDSVGIEKDEEGYDVEEYDEDNGYDEDGEGGYSDEGEYSGEQYYEEEQDEEEYDEEEEEMQSPPSDQRAPTEPVFISLLSESEDEGESEGGGSETREALEESAADGKAEELPLEPRRSVLSDGALQSPEEKHKRGQAGTEPATSVIDPKPESAARESTKTEAEESTASPRGKGIDAGLITPETAADAMDVDSRQTPQAADGVSPGDACTGIQEDAMQIDSRLEAVTESGKIVADQDQNEEPSGNGASPARRSQDEQAVVDAAKSMPAGQPPEAAVTADEAAASPSQVSEANQRQQTVPSDESQVLARSEAQQSPEPLKPVAQDHEQQEDTDSATAEDQIISEFREYQPPKFQVSAAEAAAVALPASSSITTTITTCETSDGGAEAAEQVTEAQETEVLITVKSLRSHSHRKTGSLDSTESRMADPDVRLARAGASSETQEQQSSPEPRIIVRSSRAAKHADPSVLLAQADAPSETREQQSSPEPRIIVRSSRAAKHADPSILLARASMESIGKGRDTSPTARVTRSMTEHSDHTEERHVRGSDASIPWAKASVESPSKASGDVSSPVARVTRSMTEQSDHMEELKIASHVGTRTSKRLATPELQSLRSTQTQTQTDDRESVLASPSVTGSLAAEDESLSALKRQLAKDLRANLPDCLPLRHLRSNLNKHVDILAVATCVPPQAHRPKSGPRDYMLELTLADPSCAPSSVAVAHVFRPHQASLPTVQHAGDVVLLRRMQVVSMKGRGFGVRVTDSSAWAVFEKLDEEMLPQIKGPPVEVAAEEVEYAAGLRRWWAALDGSALERMEKASQKAAQKATQASAA